MKAIAPFVKKINVLIVQVNMRKFMKKCIFSQKKLFKKNKLEAFKNNIQRINIMKCDIEK